MRSVGGWLIVNFRSGSLNYSRHRLRRLIGILWDAQAACLRGDFACLALALFGLVHAAAVHLLRLSTSDSAAEKQHPCQDPVVDFDA